MEKLHVYTIKMRRQILRRASASKPGMLQINVSGPVALKVLKSLFSPVPPAPPPVVPQAMPTLRPNLKPWAAVIDQMIEGDAGRAKRLRTSAMEVFRTLRDKHAYTGCYNSVLEYVYAVVNPERAKASALRRSQNARRGRDSVAPQEIARTTGVVSHAPRWRRARVVLTSKDPDYRAKVGVILKILSELKPDEAFFSVDEYGPFAIKIKGGKKRVAPGTQ